MTICTVYQFITCASEEMELVSWERLNVFYSVIEKQPRSMIPEGVFREFSGKNLLENARNLEEKIR
jgi:hypothetical protein